MTEFRAIKILKSGLPVVGYAKIGEGTPKNSRRKGAPIKFDHLELTGVERDADGRLCADIPLMLKMIEAGAKTCDGCERSKELADKWSVPELEGGLPVELPILLPYDDLELNFPNRLAYYRSRTAYCTGDGETAERLTIVTTIKVDGKDVYEYGKAEPYGPCGSACEDFEKRRCKPNARLRFVLAGQENIGGCYEFRTTSWNSIANLQQSLSLVQQMAGGVLSWIPLYFDIVPQTVQPRDGGPANTAYIARVSYRGNPQKLLETVHRNLTLRAPMMAEVKKLEAFASRGWDMSADEIDEFRAEFDHENAEAEPGPVVDTTAAAEAEPPEPQDAGDEPLDPKDNPFPGSDEVRDEREGHGEAEATLITPEQQRELWEEVKARAAQFAGDPSVVAPAILKAALNALGYERSSDVRDDDFAELIVGVKNAKLPQEAA